MNQQQSQALINRLHECAEEILAAAKEIPNFDPKSPIHADLFGGRYDENEIAWAQKYLSRLGAI